MPPFITPELQALVITPESRICNHHSPVNALLLPTEAQVFIPEGPVSPGSSLLNRIVHGKDGYFCHYDNELDLHLE